MKIVHHTLLYTLAWPFYRRHAGMFLFLFFLLFGIQPSLYDALRLHYAVIQSILTSPGFFVLALGIWAVYMAKTCLFVRGCLQKEAYDFLFLLNAMSQWQRFGWLLRLNMVLLAPAGVYSVLVAGISFREGQVATGLLFLLANAVLYLLVIVLELKWLRRAKGIRQVLQLRLFPFSIPPTLTGIVLRFVFRKQFPGFLLIKLVSFSSLYFFVQLDAAVFENRMLWLLFFTVLSGHSIIIYRNFRFIETELTFYRNMPVNDSKVIASLLVAYIVLLLPEAWALRGLWISQHEVRDYLWMMATGPFFLLLVHVLLYTGEMTVWEWLKLLFGVWLVFILFSLSAWRWLMPLVASLGSVLVFRLSYRLYEQDAGISKAES